jgi:hypothetical protein
MATVTVFVEIFSSTARVSFTAVINLALAIISADTLDNV